MAHSYEELRGAALDVISGRELVTYPPNQYEHLCLGVGQIFAQREGRIQPGNFGATYPLEGADKNLLLEIFWELFRQGIITLGLNDANPQFPLSRELLCGVRHRTGRAQHRSGLP